MNKKTVALLLALVLVFGAAVGGTLAWLTDKTDAVTNTFTVGNIDIDLKEHKLGDDGKLTTEEVLQNAYHFVPGDTLPKDPFVTVEDGSEACYVFLREQVTNNTVDGLTGNIVQYSIDATVWTAVPDHAGYWYCEVEAIAAGGTDVVKNVLTGSQVTINANLTKAMAEAMTGKAPVLTFTAAAVQKAHVDNVADAFAKLPTEFTK